MMSERHKLFLPAGLADDDVERAVQGSSNGSATQTPDSIPISHISTRHSPGVAARPPTGSSPRLASGFTPPIPSFAPRSSSGFVPSAPGPTPDPALVPDPTPVLPTVPATDHAPEPAPEQITFPRPQPPHVIKRLPRAENRADSAGNPSGLGPRVQGSLPAGTLPIRPPPVRPADVYAASAAALQGSNSQAARNYNVTNHPVIPQAYYHGSMTEYGHGPVTGNVEQFGRMRQASHPNSANKNQMPAQPIAQGGGSSGAGTDTGAVDSHNHQNNMNNALAQCSFRPVAKIAKRLRTQLPTNQEQGPARTQVDPPMRPGNNVAAGTSGYGAQATSQQVAQRLFGAGVRIGSDRYTTSTASAQGVGPSSTPGNMAGIYNTMQPAQTTATIPTQLNQPGAFGTTNQPNGVRVNQGQLLQPQANAAPGLATSDQSNQLTVFLPVQVNMAQGVGILSNLSALQNPQGFLVPAQAISQGAATSIPAPPAAPAVENSAAADKNPAGDGDGKTVTEPPKGPKATKPTEEDQNTNTSVWIVNLPPGITEKILLDALVVFGPFGKVFSCEVIPGGPRFKHPQSACAVAFFNRADAKRLLEFIVNQKFRIQNRPIAHAYSNKKVTVPDPALESGVSRVLIIQGDKEVADIHKLEAFLEGKMTWNTHSLEILDSKPFHAHRTIIWTFVSYFNMADTASMLIRQGFPSLRVVFGHDPSEYGAVVATDKTEKDMPANRGGQGNQGGQCNQGGPSNQGGQGNPGGQVGR